MWNWKRDKIIRGAPVPPVIGGGVCVNIAGRTQAIKYMGVDGRQGNTIHFHSSQQLSRLGHGSLKGFWVHKWPSWVLNLASYVALWTNEVLRHSHLWRVGRGGPKTPLKTTDTNLDCVLVKTHLFTWMQKLGGQDYLVLSPPVRPPVSETEPPTSLPIFWKFSHVFRASCTSNFPLISHRQGYPNKTTPISHQFTESETK